MDEKATALFPPIIPGVTYYLFSCRTLFLFNYYFIAGTFMYHGGFYNPVKNLTFVEVKLYMVIKANTRRTAMDLSMLNMG